MPYWAVILWRDTPPDIWVVSNAHETTSPHCDGGWREPFAIYEEAWWQLHNEENHKYTADTHAWRCVVVQRDIRPYANEMFPEPEEINWRE